MFNSFPPFTTSEYIGLASLILTSLIGIVAVFYGRQSYFISLKNVNNDKNMYEIADFYIREFVLSGPNKKINPFLKKIASDQLNGGIEIPSYLTDVLIKYYADYYFFLVRSLKSTWRFFIVKDDDIECIYSESELIFRGASFFILYLISGGLAFFLISNFTWYMTSFTSESATNTFSGLIMILTLLLVTCMVSLVTIFRFITIRDIVKSLNHLKNIN